MSHTEEAIAEKFHKIITDGAYSEHVIIPTVLFCGDESVLCAIISLVGVLICFCSCAPKQTCYLNVLPSLVPPYRAMAQTEQTRIQSELID